MTNHTVFNHSGYLELEASRINAVAWQAMLTTGSRIQALRRHIADQPYSDLVSVYGYPDLVSGDQVQKNVGLGKIWSEIRETMMSQSIISGYFRLGIDQQIDATQLPLVKKREIGKVVFVNLQQSYDDIQAGFRKSHRYDIKQGKKKFHLENGNDKVAEFHDIYIENMRRVGAVDYYNFSLEYMENLVSLDGVDCHLAYCENNLAAGVISITNGRSVFYHLGATKSDFLKDQPSKTLLALLIENYSEQSFDKFILGGGLGGADDSLLKFKLGFSKDTSAIDALCAVFDEKKYRQLSQFNSTENLFPDFFPAYRNN